MNISDNILIKRFVQGIFVKRPSLPRYNSTWDVNIVLSYYANTDNLTLLQLSQKLCILFLLVTAQRCQTLHLIDVQDLKFTGNECIVKTPHLLKQSKPGHHLPDILISKFHKNTNVCVVATLNEYVRRTATLRGSENKLLISTQKPHKGVHKSTVSRWVKTAMLRAGVETQFTAHSTRSASTSKAIMRGVPLSTIVKTAGWANAKTFEKFYHRKVKKGEQTFQQAIQNLQ